MSTPPHPNAQPEISILAPANGATVVEGQPFHFIGSASDDEDGGLSPMIEWSSSIDGALGTGSEIFPVLSVGTHEVRASVVDSDGSGNSAAVTVTVLADRPPTVAIVDPPDGSVVAQDSLITLRATASDPEQGPLSAAVSWASDVDGDLGVGETLRVTLSVGTHEITATVADSKGQTAQSRISVTVLADQPPTVTITAPVDGFTTESGNAVSLTGAAFDPEDGALSDAIAWSSDLDGILGTGGSLQIVLSVGTHVIKAIVTDSRGQAAEDAISVVVTAPGPTPVIHASSLVGPFGPSDLYRVEITANGRDTRVGRMTTASGQAPAITDIARADSIWYTVTFDALYTLDPGTGLLTTVGGWGIVDVNSLVWDGNGLLLATTSSGTLVTIDPSTGARATVGWLGGGLTSDGDLTIGPDGMIGGSFVSASGSVLATVDRATGEATVVGSTGLMSLWGLAWVGDQLFGMTNNGLNGGQLVQLDPATATPTVVRALSFGSSGSATPTGR
ncbi:MAG: hypothetical protein RLN75_05730 [Longimicrobiales bacterium]